MQGQESHGLLAKLGLSHTSVVNVVMTRDIVPRAFVCDYTLVADFMRSWLPGFKEHMGLASCKEHKVGMIVDCLGSAVCTRSVLTVSAVYYVSSVESMLLKGSTQGPGQAQLVIFLTGCQQGSMQCSDMLLGSSKVAAQRLCNKWHVCCHQ